MLESSSLPGNLRAFGGPVWRPSRSGKEISKMKPTYILLAIFSLCGVVVAQQETASITGQILDPTGGAVAGAAVTVMNEATSASSMLRSDSSGFYRAPNLAP